MTDTTIDEAETLPTHRVRRLILRAGGGAAVIVLLLVASFELVYAGKVYPGVTADGVILSGYSHDDAVAHLQDATNIYAGTILPISYGKTTLHLPLNTLGLKYDNPAATKLAFDYGRTGSLTRRIHEQLRALLGRPTNFAAYSYDDAQLTPYLSQIQDDVASPVADASLTFLNGHPQVTAAVDGQRLDLGELILQLEDKFATTSGTTLDAPVYGLSATVSTQALTAASTQLGSGLGAPLQLTYNQNTITIDQATIAKWMKVSATGSGSFLDTHDVLDLYPPESVASVALDPAALTAYVARLATSINQPAKNAQLAMTNGQLTVTAPSQDGVQLDQADAVKQIRAALGPGAAPRTIALKTASTQAAVRADNLASLGIVEQISEGETYFPGSPSTRLTNVRAGASKFNGVLLAPGEQFSFGKLLGEVDASTGYVPELVILGDHEEKQYGGGLCQVSSTAFRAALAAGLPINERVNHAFAISYYTWPYQVPGLDATIYYPDVDFKFTNDTGHYILMQTTMQGVDLKFDFYGTKTKSGVIRGPEFVTGTSDAKVASHTVFYRDVLDMSGAVIKTDKFDTYYKPSTDFPITKQFN